MTLIHQISAPKFLFYERPPGGEEMKEKTEKGIIVTPKIR
jgi:hypothetical protein